MLVVGARDHTEMRRLVFWAEVSTVNVRRHPLAPRQRPAHSRARRSLMLKQISLDLKMLSKLLSVDSTSPSGLRWLEKPSPFSPIHAGSPAGSIGSEGYYRIKIGNITYLNHRIVWALTHNADPGASQIDHIDGNRANNDPINLRLATHRSNSQNKLNRSRHGIGVKKQGGSFQARIRIDGKLIHLGSFATAEQAALAYQNEARKVKPLPSGEVEHG